MKLLKTEKNTQMQMVRKYFAVWMGILLCLVMGVSVSAAPGGQPWKWPFQSTSINWAYNGSNHLGVDVAGNVGDPIYAPTDATVYRKYTGCNRYGGLSTGKTCKQEGKCSPNHSYTGSGATTAGYCNNGYGNGVCLKTSDGWYIQFAHMSSVNSAITEGGTVSRGTLLGYIGGSGYATGKHSHYQVGTSEFSGTINPMTITYSDTTEVTVSFSDDTKDQSRKQIGTTTATMATTLTVSGTAITNVTSVGLRLYDAKGTWLYSSPGEKPIPKNGVINNWYSIGAGQEIDYTLYAGCTYHYQFYCNISGKTYWSEYKSFTLNGSSNYTITFNANGGSVSPTSRTVAVNTAIGTLPVPTRTGYTFLGWATAQTNGNLVDSTYKQGHINNLTVYALWAVNSYTMYFDANGGTVGEPSRTITYGASIGTLPTPTRTSYTFDGWYTAASGGSKYTATTYTTASNTTLYAHWNPILVSYVQLNEEAAQIYIGESLNLTATVQPAQALDQSVVWTSSDTAVAVVSEGIVTGIGAGNATVTATAADGSGASASCEVTVITAVEDIELSRYSLVLAEEGIGSTYQIIPVLTPEDAPCTIEWNSGDTSVAVVSENGLIEAVGTGRTVITASVPYGPSISCIVNVQEMDLVTIPKATSVIDDEAFYQTKISRVMMSGSVDRIENRAFAGNSDLYYVMIPNSVTYIAEDAFDGAKKLTILCGKNSYAEQWAISHKVDYQTDESAAEILIRQITLPKQLDINVGSVLYMKASVLPETATNKTIHWNSSNPEIAEVSESGVLTTKKVGEVLITASAADDSGCKSECRLIVTMPEVSAVMTEDQEKTVIDDTNAILSGTIALEGALANEVESVVLEVATLDGTVVGRCQKAPIISQNHIGYQFDIETDMGISLNPETTYHYTISPVLWGCEVQAGGNSFTTITAVPRIIMRAELAIGIGQSKDLAPVVKNVESKDLIWSTSKSTVASVVDGVITGVGTGTATITARLLEDTSVQAKCVVTVTEEPVEDEEEKIFSFKSERMTLRTGNSLKAVTNMPEKQIAYESSDESVCTVNEDGVVQSVALGNAVITATLMENNQVTAQCYVEVIPIAIEDVSLNRSSISMKTGETATLAASITPKEAIQGAELIWKTSDPSVVSVADGNVKAIGKGTAYVSVSIDEESGIGDFCEVTVADPVILCETVRLNKTSVTGMTVGSTQTLTASVTPDNATNKAVQWSSSDVKVAKVSSSGVITAVGGGSCTITAAAVDGSGIKATASVTVQSPVTVTFTDYAEKQSVGSTNAVIAKTISVSGSATIKDVTEVGGYLYNANEQLLKSKRETPIPKDGVINCWYDVQSELGQTLTAGTTYKYRFVAKIGGTDYYSQLFSFTTTGSINGVTVKYTDYSVKQSVSYNNAVLAKTIAVSGSASINDVTAVGCYLYNASGTQLKYKREKPVPKDGVINAWYDVASELDYTLSASTTYKYRFVAVINGSDYYSDYFTFTTPVKPDVVLPLSVSASYASGPYYTKLLEAVKNTQNSSQAEKFVQIALSQKGYKSGTSSSALDGNGTGTGTYAEYLRHIGLTSDQWCAAFVSWAARMAGIPTNVVAKSGLAKNMKLYGDVYDCWNSDYTGSGLGSYVPQRGDILCLMPTYGNEHAFREDGTLGVSAHVAIIVSVKKISSGVFELTTIERGGDIPSGVSASVLGNTVWSRTVKTNAQDSATRKWCQAIVHPHWQY